MDVSVHQRLRRKGMEEHDLVEHTYERRIFWGANAVLYHKTHPMSWKTVSGNYQNWEIDTSAIVPSDAESPYGEPSKLFYNGDVTLWLSRRKESMPYFFRNCNADELHLISQGKMTYETDFGALEVQERDFIRIPKGITYRVLLKEPQDTLRMIYESEPEIFVVPAEMMDYGDDTVPQPLALSKLQKPQLATGPKPPGEFEVRVKYNGAFSDFLGEISTFVYDFYPLDAELMEGESPVFKFSVADIERPAAFPGPTPFLAGAYLDTKSRLAFTLNLTGSGAKAPVHRDPDADELRYFSSGPDMGNIIFTPQGVDHGWGRGYTKKERNRPTGRYDVGDTISIYPTKPFKGTPIAQRFAKSFMA